MTKHADFAAHILAYLAEHASFQHYGVDTIEKQEVTVGQI